MTLSTIRKSFLSFIALIAILVLSLTAYFSFNSTVFASKVSVGSTLFTDIDNMNIAGTKDGLELSSTGKRDTSAKFSKKLYFGDNFNFTFLITETDFEFLNFTVLTDHGDKNFVGTISDEDRQYTIKLSKTEDGFKAKLNDSADVSIASSFTANITIGYDTDVNKFYINDKTTTVGDAVILTRNEGEITIGFEGIAIGKKAKLLIKNINGQSFISAEAGYAEDNIKPAVVFNNDLMNYQDSEYIESPVNKNYEIPLYCYDVLGTIKYDIKVQYSEDLTFDEEEDIENSYTSNSIRLDKEGYYKITHLKIKDSNYNEEVVDLEENTLKIIHATKWNSGASYIPEIINFEAYKDSVYDYVDNCEYIENKFLKGGSTNKFRFPFPQVQINCTPAGIKENPDNIKIELEYKIKSSGTWSKNSDGLIFSANTVNEYDFRIRAIDRMGNTSGWSDTISLTFDDYTPPKISVSGFVTEKYINQLVTLPSGSITDEMGSSTEKTVKVYYIMDENGNEVFETDENGNIIYEDAEQQIKKKILVSESNELTPDKLGWYEVIYSAKDSAGNETTLAPMTFKVINVPPPAPEPFIDLTNSWNIVFLIIAGLSALGLIILMFIKPKEEN